LFSQSLGGTVNLAVVKKQTRKSGLYQFLLLLTLGLASAGAAQPQTAGTTALHSLWKVQGKSNVVYLMGSIHVLKAENYPLPAPLEAAFTNSQIAAFETDIAAMSDPQLAFKMMSKGRLPEGETLPQQLSPEIYSMFTNHLKETGLPAEMFEHFTPALAAMMIAVLELQKQGFDPEQGLDKHFFPLARKAGKQTVALETLDFQLALLTDFTKAEGEMLMKTTLKEMETMKTEFDDMLKAWQTGDADKLEKLLNEASKESPAIYKRLLTDRNRSWIPKIEEFLRGDKNAIVIVGAAHLVGKEGVVELLKKKGYKVTQE